MFYFVQAQIFRTFSFTTYPGYFYNEIDNIVQSSLAIW